MIEERVPNNHNLSVIAGYIAVIVGWIILLNVLRSRIASNTEFLGLAFLSLVVAFVIMYFWQKYKRRSFCCPNCKTHIPESQPVADKPGSPIHHYCDKCKIHWLLGKTAYPGFGDSVGGE